jgi:hypothetical protein
MAAGAVGGIMRSGEGEAAPLVDLRDVVDDPRIRSVAPSAVGADGLVMHIGMTIHAGGLCF